MVEAEAKQFLRCQHRHTSLIWRSVAFALIAFYASRYQVRRRAFAALSSRQNVIERQVFRMLGFAAILTAIPVANVNAGTFHRAFATVAANVDVMPQAYDRRNRKRRRWRMKHIVAIVLFDEDRAAKPQTNSSGNTNGSQRFIRKV